MVQKNANVFDCEKEASAKNIAKDSLVIDFATHHSLYSPFDDAAGSTFFAALVV